MRDDGPDVPGAQRYTSGERDDMPAWPEAMGRPRRSFSAVTQSVPPGAVLALSLGANAAFLVVLVVLLFLARAGYFSPQVSSTPSVPATNTTPVSTQVLPSPTASQGWLQVAPASVQLGCDGGQQRQYAVLVNTGPEDVQWQAVFSIPSDQAGVYISPQDGDLQPGTSIALRIQSNGNASGQQGTIRFVFDATTAGPPPTLSFTTANCQ